MVLKGQAPTFFGTDHETKKGVESDEFVGSRKGGCLIAGSASGVGKTTVALAIVAGLRRRGVRVQPFKGGPDFLDTGHLTRIARRTARNVDTWMLSPEANVKAVRAAAADADFVLIEGMMGLFDGKSGETDAGSSAEIARLLRLPVVLVVDAGKSARSLAAVVLGFEMFDAATPLAGVILNRVASERHYAMLAAAIGQRCRTPILGWLPREPAIAIPERHLGLRTAEESGGDPEAETDRLAALAERYLDLDALATLDCGLPFHAAAVEAPSGGGLRVRIGVARDAAFSFYYEDNFDLLREQGAELVEFSPLADPRLPENLDALYIGGGYPELHVAQLADNLSMLADIREFAAQGRPVYAECGGMMLLGESLSVLNQPPGSGAVDYAMAGVLPLRLEMTGKLVKFGYVTAEFTRDCLLGAAGTTARGHSFHYSRLVGEPTLETAYRVRYSLSGKDEKEGFTAGNVLASYVHLHFGAAPALAKSFVAAAQAAKGQRRVLVQV